MDYNKTLTFLYEQLPVFQREGKSAYKANLNNTYALDAFFKFPHTHYKTIHVAGTNGKGSVSHMLSSVLQQAGLKVGLYTSPHLLDMRERIKVNGTMAPKQFVVDFVAENMEVIQKIKPSFFELMVMMAFRYFSDQQVDVAIIEVGMGGRLDSTNVITPLLSIITNIGLDHTQFLGGTIAQIAGEKGGIIKPGVPVVIGERNEASDDVFSKLAEEANSRLYFAEEEFVIQAFENIDALQKVTFLHASKPNTFTTDLLGEYQKKNMATALCALEVLKKKLPISHKNIQQGLLKVGTTTGLKGRWQVLGQDPLIVCDTGHNKEGLAYVVSQMLSQQCNKIHLVLGLVSEKDAQEILTLFPAHALFYLTKADIPRAMETQELVSAAQKLNLNSCKIPVVKDAVKQAINNAEKNDLVFIGGSTFVVAEALAYFAN